DFIARNGFDRDFGARPVKRAVQNYVENPLAKLILAGKFSDECKIKVLAAGDKLDFEEA
ncbi:MAG TPA: AAA family ATPase, partial [Treponema sp.]|nr:AAA family ATPase [Treponema sp.]